MKQGTLIVLTSIDKQHSHLCEYEGETQSHHIVTNKHGMLDLFRKDSYTLEEVKRAEK